MFLTRLVTGLLLSALTLYLFLQTKSYAEPFLAIAFIVAAWEWSRLAEYKHLISRLLYTLCATAIVPLLSYVVFTLNYLDLRHLSLFTSFFWAGIGFALWMNRRTLRHAGPGLRGFLGLILLPVSALLALSLLQNDAPSALPLLVLIALVAISDSVAYIVGSLLGRHRLAPALSPKKSWEGFIAGFSATILLGTPLLQWCFPSVDIVWLGLLAGGISLFALFGDLAESALKRMAGVKDSGRLLPGHGGVLDRIDAIFGALPLFAWVFFTVG
ncbi:MAG: phosphatidate cytidylyltransferase [Pseudomonadota bacterium]